jgi:hypothetical protein
MKGITLSETIAIFCADIEIKLLLEDDQETYKEKLFSKEEIMEQMEKSMIALLKIFTNTGFERHESLKK